MHVHVWYELCSARHRCQVTLGVSIEIVGIALRNRGPGLSAFNTAEPRGYPGPKARCRDDGSPLRSVTAKIQIAYHGALGFCRCQFGEVCEKGAAVRV